MRLISRGAVSLGRGRRTRPEIWVRGSGRRWDRTKRSSAGCDKLPRLSNVVDTPFRSYS